MYAKGKESSIAHVVIKPNKIVHQICTSFVPKRKELGIEYGAFLGALMLMMVTKFVSNSTIRWCIFATIILNMVVICIKYNSNLAIYSDAEKLLKIRNKICTNFVL